MAEISRRDLMKAVGLSVIGLVNHESFDWNSAKAAEYSIVPAGPFGVMYRGQNLIPQSLTVDRAIMARKMGIKSKNLGFDDGKTVEKFDLNPETNRHESEVFLANIGMRVAWYQFVVDFCSVADSWDQLPLGNMDDGSSVWISYRIRTILVRGEDLFGLCDG